MIRAVWKYKLKIKDKQEIMMPYGTKILHIDIQHGTPFIWALVPIEENLEKRTFLIKGTGHPVTETYLHHKGSFLMENDSLVWHVFEKILHTQGEQND